MLDLIIGYCVSQLVHVAAKLGLADLLKGAPKAPAELARSAGVDPRALHRVLRALASAGVFAERKDGRFALTPLAATLRSDRPDSMRAFAIMMVEDYN
jgi:DNA-binding IclR family transcriptional regulator